MKKWKERFKRAWEAFSEDEKPPPTKSDEPAPTPFWIKAMTWVGALVLIVMGYLVLREGLALWEDDTPPAVSKRASEITLTKPAEEASVETKAQPEGKEPAGTPADGKEPAGADQGKAGDVQKTGGGQAEPSQAKASPSEQITGKWPTSPATRSETLSLALLGTGAALLLAGAFAPRLTSVKLPGGTEMTMTDWNGAAAAALVSAQSVKDGKPEVAEDPRKVIQGARMLIEQGSIPEAQAPGARTMAPVEAEAMLLSSPKLERQAKRVVEYLSSDQ